jgi:hypothetical protein
MLACGLVAGPLFVATAILQMLTRDGFDLLGTPSACCRSASMAGFK